MEEITYKNINAEDFARLDFSKVTLVDLREPDEVLVSGIEGAINIPFSSFPKGLDDIPRDKPVYVYCREGSFSEEVAEILSDRNQKRNRKNQKWFRFLRRKNTLMQRLFDARDRS